MNRAIEVMTKVQSALDRVRFMSVDSLPFGL